MSTEPDWDAVAEQQIEAECDWFGDTRSQCCPMDTWSTDSDGHLRYECTCVDGCDCMCTGCVCAAWSEEDEEPY